jgi:kynurenine 3-monooxygenase
VIEAAQRYLNVRVHFNHKCTGVDLNEATAYLEIEAGKVSAKGIRSSASMAHSPTVRQSIQKKLAEFEYDESYLAHGYKELTIPPVADGSWRMEKEGSTSGRARAS